jgi:DNA-binding MarR family transcriptional regulator
LTEGVDIPAVDMVAFIDPRQSRVDIAQAVGRAMRKPRGRSEKTVGYVFVPLFVGEQGETIEDAIKGERFDAVADVLNALQEHDEELVDLIRELRQAKGEGKPFKPRITGEKIELIGPRVDLDRIVESVETRIADQLGASWDEYFGVLVSYVERFSTAAVPSDAVWVGRPVGHWVATQRSWYRKRILTAARIQRLESLPGWIWDAHEEQWWANYVTLRTSLTTNTIADLEVLRGDPTVSWMINQRVRRRETAKENDRKPLSIEQQKALESLPGWVWSRLDARWTENLEGLKKLIAANNGELPKTSEKYSSIRPRRWLTKQLSKIGRLSREQYQQLLEIDAVKTLLEDRSISAPADLSDIEIRVLGVFGSTDNAQYQPAELAAACAASRSTVSTALKRLKSKGCIISVRDTEDGRGRVITLTDKGRQMSYQCSEYVRSKK